MTLYSRKNQFFSGHLYDIFSGHRHANSCLNSIFLTQAFYVQNYKIHHPRMFVKYSGSANKKTPSVWKNGHVHF